MRVDLHTHVVPPRWDDWAARFGGGTWPRLVVKDACHATIMTGDQFFRDIDDRSWDPARRLEDMDRLGIDMQALSPPPVMFCYWANGWRCRRWRSAPAPGAATSTIPHCSTSLPPAGTSGWPCSSIRRHRSSARSG
jgi:hypothetical protein